MSVTTETIRRYECDQCGNSAKGEPDDMDLPDEFFTVAVSFEHEEIGEVSDISDQRLVCSSSCATQFILDSV